MCSSYSRGIVGVFVSCMYLSMRGVCSWLVYESVHKGFVCVLKYSGILFVSLLECTG